MQTLLIARGYDIGEPDGLIGAHTRNALQKAQRELGLPADGRAGQKVCGPCAATPAERQGQDCKYRFPRAPRPGFPQATAYTGFPLFFREHGDEPVDTLASMAGGGGGQQGGNASLLPALIGT